MTKTMAKRFLHTWFAIIALLRVGETFLMQLHRSRPEPRLSTFERCWLSGATGLAQRTGDTRDLFALRSLGSVSPLCPSCAPVKANGAARKAHERDKRAQKPDCVAVCAVLCEPVSASLPLLFPCYPHFSGIKSQFWGLRRLAGFEFISVFADSF